MLVWNVVDLFMNVLRANMSPCLNAGSTGSGCHVIKSKHEKLGVQCMNLFNEGYIREHTGQWSVVS